MSCTEISLVFTMPIDTLHNTHPEILDSFLVRRIGGTDEMIVVEICGFR